MIEPITARQKIILYTAAITGYLLMAVGVAGFLWTAFAYPVATVFLVTFLALLVLGNATATVALDDLKDRQLYVKPRKKGLGGS